MAPSNKINLKDKVEDGELDLSMSGLQEVPVKEIAQIKKIHKLDLSNNRLTYLGKNFASSLSHISHLDLSNNTLKELPENFGNLKQLKHLDLYNNQIKHLPLSFSQLKSLKWLDLKNNPLVPALAQVAGPCLDAPQCQQSARKVVDFMAKMQNQVDDMSSKQRANQKSKEANSTANAKQNKQQQQQQQQQKNKKKDNKPEKQTSKVNLAAKDSTKANAEKQTAKAKKAKNTKKQNRKQSFFASVAKKFFILVFLACLILPFLSFIHQEHVKKNSSEYQLVSGQLSKVWNMTVSVMPDSVLHYGSVGYQYAKPVTDFVGQKSVIIFEMISELKQTEQYKLLKLQVQNLFDLLVSKISELYRNVYPPPAAVAN